MVYHLWRSLLGYGLGFMLMAFHFKDADKPLPEIFGFSIAFIVALVGAGMIYLSGYEWRASDEREK